LLERAALTQIGDGHVVAHVDQLLAVRLRPPLLERGPERPALRLDHEVDVTGRPAEGRRRLARLDVVDRHRAAEGHVEVRMRIDAAREHILAGGVDHPVGRHVERFADQRDRLVLDVEIRDVIVGGGDDATAVNQNRHLLVLLAARGRERRADAALATRVYLPPALSVTEIGLKPLPFTSTPLAWFFRYCSAAFDSDAS